MVRVISGHGRASVVEVDDSGTGQHGQHGQRAPVLAVQSWPTNGHLIADLHRLGYIHGDIYDPTYGEGTWWSVIRPEGLYASDIRVAQSPMGVSVDFCDNGFNAESFDTVAFDPPYKLNGTPDVEIDARYGVHEVTRWQDRIDLIYLGMVECARVLRPGGHLLLKCQDQVSSGKVRWQTYWFTRHGEDECGLDLIDRLDMLSYRPQPDGTSQVHARRNTSTMLVFKKRG